MPRIVIKEVPEFCASTMETFGVRPMKSATFLMRSSAIVFSEKAVTAIGAVDNASSRPRAVTMMSPSATGAAAVEPLVA